MQPSPSDAVLLPAPVQAALLLDLDGTLLDIAPTPNTVTVPPGLADALLAVRAALGGAMAIISGRPIAEIDALLPGVPYAVAGEHGGVIRAAPAALTVRPALPDLPKGWMDEAERIARHHPGTLLEPKQRGFVLHYRAVPEHGPALGAAASALLAPLADRFLLMPALMAWEVRPRGADKGSAVRALSIAAPFAGRRPIFIGDDVTDEDGMAAARQLGGAGLRVDEWFGSAGGVRAWLTASAAALAAGGAWPGLPLR